MAHTNLLVANLAWTRHQRILALAGLLEDTFLHLGEALYWFERERLYLEMDYPSFESYLAAPDVNIGRRMAFMVKRVYERWVLELNSEPAALADVGITKLNLLASVATEANRDELLAQGSALSRSDLRVEYGPPSAAFSDNGPQGGITVTLHPHALDKFDPDPWCDDCRWDAEHQHKLRAGWRQYALRCEERMNTLQAELDELRTVTYEPNDVVTLEMLDIG